MTLSIVRRDGISFVDGSRGRRIAQILLPFTLRSRQVLIRSGSLRCVHHDDVVATPRRIGRAHVGCLHEPSGRVIPLSLRPSAGLPSRPVDRRRRFEPGELPVVEGDSFVYLGTFFTAFGHFLLETLSRAWIVGTLKRRDFSFLFHHWESGDPEVFKASAPRFCLAALGIDVERVHMISISRDERYRGQVVVPEQAFSINHSCHVVYREIARAVVARLEERHPGLLAGRSGRRIYLSRRQHSRRSAANEGEVEDLFQAHGFEILVPEALPFAEQVATVRSAEIIAGCDGSALHLSMFGRPGLTVISLDRRRNLNQYALDRLFDLDAWHVWAVRRLLPDDRWEIEIELVRRSLDAILASRLHGGAQGLT